MVSVEKETLPLHFLMSDEMGITLYGFVPVTALTSFAGDRLLTNLSTNFQCAKRFVDFLSLPSLHHVLLPVLDIHAPCRLLAEAAALQVEDIL